MFVLCDYIEQKPNIMYKKSPKILKKIKIKASLNKARKEISDLKSKMKIYRIHQPSKIFT